MTPLRPATALVLAAGLALAPSAPASPEPAAAFDHGPWDALLDAHVRALRGGRESRVDYEGFEADRARLAAYLDALAAVERGTFEGWPPSGQLAFLINAYNAWTVELILRERPLDSIRDIGWLPGAAWRRRIASLFGERRSLDDIEHGMIRGWDRYREPRIHFAVNCAAVGCPALRAEAYTGARLEAQLEDGARRFLADPTRNRFEDGRLHLSPLFDWYEEDFGGGRRGADSVYGFIARRGEAMGLDAAQRARVARGEAPISYTRYDWALNGVP